jgi:CsoR family transcriptional regulator, copper-sensing transcriptional repressor
MARRKVIPKVMSQEASVHPSHVVDIPRLKRIIGQLEGVERMIRERRYCPEILQQLRAANSAVKALELEILKGHLGSCIKASARHDGNAAFVRKLDEILNLIRN